MQIVNPTPAAMYSGITNAVAQISSTEGVRSLWRGIASVAVGAGMLCFSTQTLERGEREGGGGGIAFVRDFLIVTIFFYHRPCPRSLFRNL